MSVVHAVVIFHAVVVVAMIVVHLSNGGGAGNGCSMCSGYGGGMVLVCTLGCVFIWKSENLAYATPKFDVGAYIEHKKIISRIFLAPLPTGNACFVNPLFW